MEGKRLRFVHPPRTGGSSIIRSWGINRRSGEAQGHHPVQRRYPDGKPSDMWVYGFTRNPWDRAVSLYHLAHPQAPESLKRLVWSFQEWALEGMSGEYHFGKRFEQQIAQPTWWWLHCADWVGRFESRAQDLKKLSKLLDRPVPQEHVAKSQGRLPDYHTYYEGNDEVVGYVRQRYAEDIEYFGYEF